MMTQLDRLLEALTADIRQLPTRSTILLFAACATGLRPAFVAWEAVRRTGNQGLLDRAISAAYSYMREGQVPGDLKSLLKLMEDATPPGDSPDAVSSTDAQDCWISADTAIRLMVDPAFDAAPVIYYALEPIVQATTLDLYGVSDVGSGENEAAMVARVAEDARVMAAVGFLRWAVERLGAEGAEDDELVDQLQARSIALSPLSPDRTTPSSASL